MKSARYIAQAWTTLLAVASVAGCGGGTGACDGVGQMCRLAGTYEQRFLPAADGMKAADVPLYWVSQVGKGPDGRTYVMEQNAYRLHAIELDGTLSLVAGNTIHGGFIEGADPKDTPLFDPMDFAFRPDGRLVMLLWHDGRLAEIGTDGKMKRIFGTKFESQPGGGCVGTGDGGPAIDAQFCELGAIAIDGKGRIFVADDSAQQIRMIDTDGIVTTLLGDGDTGYDGDGGPAKSAHIDIDGEVGLAVDDKSLFFTDTMNHVIRKIDLETQIITTVAGNGNQGYGGDGGPCLEATFRQPGGVAVDTDGTLYVSDSYNNRIRKVDLANDVVTTIAGDGKLGYIGDGKLAVDAELHTPSRMTISNGTLYIADFLNNVARSIRLR